MNDFLAAPVRLSDQTRSVHDTALCFECGGERLIGILSAAPPSGAMADALSGTPSGALSGTLSGKTSNQTSGQTPGGRGVLIVVGGPQYRAGSHRQFTLLARGLAAAGMPTLRFDYRGMGDSEGAPRSFDDVDADLKAAIDVFFTACPDLRSVVIWGLCDAACAALFYAGSDARVSGLVLLNPWARTDTGAARTQLRHYYLARLREPDFWRKILAGRMDYRAALRGIGSALRLLLGAGRAVGQADAAAPGDGLPSAGTPSGVEKAAAQPTRLPLPAALRNAVARFNGRILLIVSGRDLTAREFLDSVAASREWRAGLQAQRIMRHDLAAADHTFSRREWRDQVLERTRAWLGAW